MTFFLGICVVALVILKFMGYVWCVAFILKILNVAPLNEYSYSQFGIWWLGLFVMGMIVYFLTYIFAENTY